MRLYANSTGPIALCILKAQDVTTNGMYRLPHAIYYCSYPVSDSPQAILAGDHHEIAHAQFAEGLHCSAFHCLCVHVCLCVFGGCGGSFLPLASALLGEIISNLIKLM